MVSTAGRTQLPGTGTASLRGLSFDQKIVCVTVLPFVFFGAVRLLGGLPTGLAIVTLYLGGPHVMATVGLYSDREVWQLARSDPRRYLVIPLLTIPATMLAFGVVPATAGLVLLTGFLVWQTHHFTKQNFGMFSFWCRARGLDAASSNERSLILATTAIGTVGIIRAMDWLPGYQGALRVLGLALVVSGLVQALRIGTGARTWALVASVLFYLPLHAFEVDILAASFIYAAAHGAQYYLMVGHTVRADRRAVRSTVLVVLVGGTALLAISSTSVFESAPWLFGLGKGIVAAHFVADASIWRLRDSGVRHLMRERFAFL